MIKLIVGRKGSGKTKTLINMVNEATSNAKGNVVCIEDVYKRQVLYSVVFTISLNSGKVSSAYFVMR